MPVYPEEGAIHSMKAIVINDGRLRLEEILMPVPALPRYWSGIASAVSVAPTSTLTRHAKEVFDVYAALGMVSDEAKADPRIMLGH